MQLNSSFGSELTTQFDQFIIYGANGWMGRSTISVLTELRIPAAKLLLIGSQSSTLKLGAKTFEILDSSNAQNKLLGKSLFFNYAFLRRENLQKVSKSDYIARNNEIAQGALDLVKSQTVMTLINASSGVALEANLSIDEAEDLYATLKAISETKLAEFCNLENIAFINCRIYSLTGRYINEFDNLAISNFVKQARDLGFIKVKSPETKRTFVDAEDLSRVLLKLASTNKNYSFDSGGELTNMFDLARMVASEIGNIDVIERSEKTEPTSYFGNYSNFNKLASELGIKLKNLKEQIELTVPAIKQALSTD